MDAQGKQVYHANYQATNEGSRRVTIDLEGWIPGIYTVQITINGEQINKRMFVIE